ncbi:hypothetical protein HF394_17050 [Planococcus glaciei]|uniref:Uncharacterized protein n=1 Tax=Planococcus glaciei TaxID=459472 RepID=A0A7H8QDQ5_9BACL|nr:hypothetical protein [Planococcus glaciei]QDY46523.1 hypothetical protein FK545_17790 [Planococcus glaciei]QKX52144.1 hypothetical protein HF394_17050 [Planococcus glaciei]
MNMNTNIIISIRRTCKSNPDQPQIIGWSGFFNLKVFCPVSGEKSISISESLKKLRVFPVRFSERDVK